MDEPGLVRRGAEGNEYHVKEVLDRRTTEDRQFEYLISWEFYGPEHDTWEPERNLTDCQEMVLRFERKRHRENKQYKKSQQSGTAEEHMSGSSTDDFDTEDLKIIGATKSTGELVFLMKWTKTNIEKKIPARIVADACPHLIADFYLERAEQHAQARHSQNL